MRFTLRFLLTAAIALALAYPVRAQAALSLFVQASLPEGVAVDGAGNVYIVSDAVTSVVLSKLDANGNLLGQVPVGGITVGNLGRLVFDPASGSLLYLVQTGQILVVDPNTLQGGVAVDLKAIPVDTSSIYDIVSGTTQNGLPGIINPQFSNYNDIAVLPRANATDYFISGSTQGFPFILRLRVFADQTFQAKVLVSTLGPSHPINEGPRGVAVNQNGLVMTTLPASVVHEYLVVFNADFPETGQGAPQAVADGVFALGAATDASGNFYLPFSPAGCGGNPVTGGGAAYLVIAADLSGALCGPPAPGLFNGHEVAVSPADGMVYISAGNGVYRTPSPLGGQSSFDQELPPPSTQTFQLFMPSVGR